MASPKPRPSRILGLPWHPAVVRQPSGNPEEESSPPSTPRFRSRRSRTTHLTADPKNLFEKFEVFRECSDQFLEVMSLQAGKVICEAGKVICQEGDIGTCMFLIDFGQVDVIVGDNHVATLEDGALFGEMAVICANASAGKRHATVRAKTACCFWCVDRHMLMRALAAFPKDRAIFSAHSERRLKKLQDKALAPTRADREWFKASIGAPRASLNQKRASVMAKLKFLSASKVHQEDSAPQSSADTEDSALQSSADTEADVFLDIWGPQQSREQTISADDNKAEESQGKPATKKHPRTVSRHSFVALSPSGYESPLERAVLPSMDRRGHSGMHCRREGWKIGVTAEVSKTRHDAMAFLSKRGMMP